MRATTVRVDGELLKDLERTKPKGATLTGWVRDVLRREMQRRTLEAAAVRYTAFLRDASEERDWLADWGTAGLGRPPDRDRADTRDLA